MYELILNCIESVKLIKRYCMQFVFNSYQSREKKKTDENPKNVSELIFKAINAFVSIFVMLEKKIKGRIL